MQPTPAQRSQIEKTLGPLGHIVAWQDAAFYLAPTWTVATLTPGQMCFCKEDVKLLLVKGQEDDMAQRGKKQRGGVTEKSI
jgi:hypothetical protein